MGIPGGSVIKNPPANAEDMDSIPSLEVPPGGLGVSPEGGHCNPLQYSCLRNPHGQWSLARLHSPWGLNELDTTEQLSTQHT